MFPKGVFGNPETTQIAVEEKEREKEREFHREQQRMETVSNDDASYMATQDNKSDLLRWQQDLDDELMSLVETMLGRSKVYIQKTDEHKWVKVSEPTCNKQFVSEIVIPQCKPFMTRNLINSNWNERIINLRLKITANTIADAMADSWDEYDVEFRNFDVILNQIKTTIQAGAYRALNGWTKKIDSTMIKRIESMNEKEQNMKQNQGILGGLFKSG